MRLKSFLLCIFLLHTFILKAQDQLDFHSQNWEPGKCYSFHVLTHEDDSIPVAEERFFKISPPRWDTIPQTVTGGDISVLHILEREAYTHFVIGNFSQVEAGAKNETALSICLVEHPAKYRTITFDNKDTIINLEVYQLAEFPKIIELNKKDFPDIPYDANQSYGALIQEDELRYFKLKKGNWSSPSEINNGTYCPSDLVKRVQEKLIELGYDLEANNILDPKTKAALLDFQKKHGLPSMELNLEMLLGLGINN